MKWGAGRTLGGEWGEGGGRGRTDDKIQGFITTHCDCRISGTVVSIIHSGIAYTFTKL